MSVDSGEIRLPMTQNTLESLGIQIPVQKFIDGDIRKPVSVPGTFHRQPQNGQGLLFYFGFSLFVVSSSGMAVLTMPIIDALAVIVNIPGREIMNACMYGISLMSCITPTGLMLPRFGNGERQHESMVQGYHSFSFCGNIAWHDRFADRCQGMKTTLYMEIINNCQFVIRKYLIIRPKIIRLPGKLSCPGPLNFHCTFR